MGTRGGQRRDRVSRTRVENDWRQVLTTKHAGPRFCFTTDARRRIDNNQVRLAEVYLLFRLPRMPRREDVISKPAQSVFVQPTQICMGFNDQDCLHWAAPFA